MQDTNSQRMKHLDFILIDVACVELAFFIAYNIRFGNAFQDIQASYSMLNLFTILVHIAVAFFTECYTGILRRDRGQELRKVFVHNFIMFAMILLALFFAKMSTDYSRIVFFLFFWIDTVVMFVFRTVRKQMILSRNAERKSATQLLLVSTKRYAKEAVHNLKSEHFTGFRILGVAIIDADMQGREIEGIPVVAGMKNLYEYAKDQIVDEVYLKCDSNEALIITNKFLTMGIKVHISIERFLSELPNPVIEQINDNTVVTTSLNMVTFKQKIIKRLMDIIGSIIGLIITGILFLIFAPIIYIQSPGPVFFKQNRVGKNGRIFKIYKFRSMYMDAEERKKELMAQNKMQGHMFKMDNDPRIIPIGHFIRKTSIDEFPQFWNVLKGDMSLVGTRPPTVDEYKEYDLHHLSRLAIKPGITGLWQVSGRSDITDFEEVVELDNEYIRNFSLSLDVKILLKTIGVVFKMKGSK